MDARLTNEQETLLKRTRDILGGVRDTLASSSSTAEEREALAESMRQLDELFLLVVAGEFNAGKSSFVNALLGTEGLLQTGVTPTTSQIWLLKHGAELSESPREKGVWVQTAPIPMLETLNIVDTPGTNAINREHEALTTDFIPRSDLVLFLTSADRPFSESERQFLEKISEWGKKIIFVINKIDMFEDDSDRNQVIQFVTDQARELIGEKPNVFPVSAKLAAKAKAGNPQHWEASGFDPLEKHIESTLDERGRFRLKLLNPIGVGKKLVESRLDYISGDWSMLEQDKQLLSDIEGQMSFYDDDIERNFEARLSEIQTILYEMEQRGNAFFDDTLRIGRIPDLIRRGYVAEQFETDVLKDVPRQIEDRVGELVDWMVEQDLRQWTAVSDHLSKRNDALNTRVVGSGTAQETTLAYDRQRLVDSISKSARKSVDSYDKVHEIDQINVRVREAIGGVAGLGVAAGATVTVALTTAMLDVTGILAGMIIGGLGLFVFPNRRNKAKADLAKRLADMKDELLNTLRDQFHREHRRSRQRLDDAIAPFSRFVRAESSKIEDVRDRLMDLDHELAGLSQQTEAL